MPYVEKSSEYLPTIPESLSVGDQDIIYPAVPSAITLPPDHPDYWKEPESD